MQRRTIIVRAHPAAALELFAHHANVEPSACQQVCEVDECHDQLYDAKGTEVDLHDWISWQQWERRTQWARVGMV